MTTAQQAGITYIVVAEALGLYALHFRQPGNQVISWYKVQCCRTQCDCGVEVLSHKSMSTTHGNLNIHHVVTRAWAKCAEIVLASRNYRLHESHFRTMSFMRNAQFRSRHIDSVRTPLLLKRQNIEASTSNLHPLGEHWQNLQDIVCTLCHSFIKRCFCKNGTDNRHKFVVQIT